MLLKGKVQTGHAALRRHGTLAHVEGVHFMTYLLHAAPSADALGPDFQVLHWKVCPFSRRRPIG